MFKVVSARLRDLLQCGHRFIAENLKDSNLLTKIFYFDFSFHSNIS